MATRGPGFQRLREDLEEPARPLHLVYTDESGKLRVDGAAVQACFMDPALSDLPVCLICSIGEMRRGKSFLLNYILRALSCQERNEPLSLGLDEEPVTGFEWKPGTNTITRGIWIWNKPFILEVMRVKMVVFVLDTEGSLDPQGSREICMKLAALCIILSSYLIFNVNSFLKTTELDYLEMYLSVAKKTELSFDLPYLQHINILVRDWYDFEGCSRDGARSYLNQVKQEIENHPELPSLQKVLQSSMVTCSLLPHPGISLLMSHQGKLSDMDECFRNRLTSYISDLVGSIWRHNKTDKNGQTVTCHKLAEILKKMVNILQNEEYSFASPMQLYFSFENYKAMQQCKEQFQNALNSMAPNGFSPFKILKMSPSDMEANVHSKANAVLQECGTSLQGIDDEKKRRYMADMQSQLDQQKNLFCSKYSKIHCAVKTGCLVGGTMLFMTGVVAGGAFGAGVAGAVLTAETAAGAVGGSVLLGTVGTGLGSIAGKIIGLIRSRIEQCEGGATDMSGHNSSQS